MLRSVSVLGLASLGLALAGLVGCYTVEFDENKADVYYCTGDNECLANQACEQFRCVDDSGPQVTITLPEELTPIPETATSLVVDWSVDDFVISDSNSVVEGQGKILVSIDEQEQFTTLAVTEDGIALDITSGLEPGAHRLWVQAVHGDGTPYTNPGAIAYTVFFVEEQTMAGEDTGRSQVAITSPGPNYVHVAGEPLEVTIAVRNYEIVDNGNDCHIAEGCDPWNELTPECNTCPETPAGHAHIYIEDDYPGCLFDTPIGCNGDYILSLRPSETVSTTGDSATAVIPGNRFEEAGTYTFSAALQYNDHDPFPNNEFVIYDQITLVVVE